MERERSGQGQAIELPMFETLAQFVLSDHFGGRAFEPPIGQPGYSRLLARDRRPYRTSDGYICILVYTDRQWESFFRIIGKPEQFHADPRFKDPAARSRHYAEAYTLLAEVMTTRTTAEWLAALQEGDIPAVPMHDLDALIDDPHLAAVGFFHEMDHPTEGRIRLVGIPSRWSRSQPAITRHPPGPRRAHVRGAARDRLRARARSRGSPPTAPSHRRARAAPQAAEYANEFRLHRDAGAAAQSGRRLCERFDDDYWLQRDRDGGFPHDFHRAFAQAGWLGIAMPEEYRRRRPRHHRGRPDDAGGRRIRRRLLRRLGAAHEHLRAQSGGGVRHRRAEAPHAAAADRRRPTRPASR